jgi:hypothetical protein
VLDRALQLAIAESPVQEDQFAALWHVLDEAVIAAEHLQACQAVPQQVQALWRLRRAVLALERAGTSLIHCGRPLCRCTSRSYSFSCSSSPLWRVIPARVWRETTEHAENLWLRVTYQCDLNVSATDNLNV